MMADDLRDASKDTAASAKNAADEAASTAAATAKDTFADSKSAASATYDKAKDHASGLRDNLPGSADDMVEAGKRAYAQGSERLGRQVSRQPIEALLLAGAIGYLVGWAANRG